jgi:hypothetical protein
MIQSRVVAIFVVAIVGVAACGGSGSGAIAARQAQVAARGATVMPFDQNRTTHVFHATASGGVQRVVANDPHDARQITLIRAHLRKEASRFAAGNFADPMAIHGMKMPGLDALRRGVARVHVIFGPIPSGAKITYTTAEPGLVTALHDWFDAQLVDHGSHAHG